MESKYPLNTTENIQALFNVLCSVQKIEDLLGTITGVNIYIVFTPQTVHGLSEEGPYQIDLRHECWVMSPLLILGLGVNSRAMKSC